MQQISLEEMAYGVQAEISNTALLEQDVKELHEFLCTVN